MKSESVSAIRRKCALDGAKTRLEALETEVAAIQRLFPELSSTARVAPPAARLKVVKDGRSQWSAKRKREHAERMRKFWANRAKNKTFPKTEQAHSRKQAKTWDGYITNKRFANERPKAISRKKTA